MYLQKLIWLYVNLLFSFFGDDEGGGSESEGESDSGGDSGGVAETFDDLVVDSMPESSHENEKKFPKPQKKENPMPDLGGDRNNNKKQEAKPEQGKDQEEIADMIEYLKAKVGEDEIDIHPDALLDLDDENSASISDLINNYKASDEIARMKQQYYEENNLFETQRKQHMEDLEHSRLVKHEYSRLKEMFTGDKMYDGVFHMFDSMGINPSQVYDTLTKNLFPDLETAYSEMSPQEFANYQLHARNNFMSKFQEVQVQRVNSERERYELSNKINLIKKQYGVEDSHFKSAYDKMMNLKSNGQLNLELNPENIAKVAMQQYVDEIAPRLLESIEKGFSQDKDLLNSVVKILDNERMRLGRNFSSGELTAIRQSIIDIYSEEESSTVEKKSPKNISKPKNKVYETFDDLE